MVSEKKIKMLNFTDDGDNDDNGCQVMTIPHMNLWFRKAKKGMNTLVRF